VNIEENVEGPEGEEEEEEGGGRLRLVGFLSDNDDVEWYNLAGIMVVPK